LARAGRQAARWLRVAHRPRSEPATRTTLPLEADLHNEARVIISLDASKIADGLSFARDGATPLSAEGDPVAARINANLAGAFRVAAVETGGLPNPPNPPKPIDLPANPQGYPITFPGQIPLPALPIDNPLITTRIALGEKLFREPKLSKNNSISSASRHQG
jgi:hypothetical protein